MSMNSPSIVVFGAGKIGRGFVADLFHAAGYTLVFIDKSETLIERLNKAGRYTVVRAPGPDDIRRVTIDGYTALHTSQQAEVEGAVVAADLLAISVFPGDFAAVAQQLAPAVTAKHRAHPDKPFDILLCTNLAHADAQFREQLGEALEPEVRDEVMAHTGIVQCLVIRMAVDAPEEMRQGDPLLVYSNGYPYLYVDKQGFRGQVPQVPGVCPVEDMRAEEARKLLTYNLFQAALAYLGARKGYLLSSECIGDASVLEVAKGALEESSAALQSEYGFSSEDMAMWNGNVVAQTSNPLLGDTVARLAGDPKRKLARGDRLVGAALLARKHGLPTPNLVKAIVAGLLYAAPEDAGAKAVQQQMAESGIGGAISEICGLTEAEGSLARDIAAAYTRMRVEEQWAAAAQRAYDLGFEYEKIYHGCGQCALAAVLEALDRFEPSVFNAATPLSAGIGLCGENATCSALIGGALAFGLAHPRRREHFDGDRESKYRAFEMAQRLRERYLQHYGTITCHQIHTKLMGRGYDLREAAEREAFEAAGAHTDKCTAVVANAAKWAVEIIGEMSMAEDEARS